MYLKKKKNNSTEEAGWILMNEYKPVFITKQQIQFLILLAHNGQRHKCQIKTEITKRGNSNTILTCLQIMQPQATAKVFTSSHVFQTRK